MAAIVPCILTTDTNNRPLDGVIKPAGWVDAFVLAAGVAETYTVPASARFVIFSATADFYANFNGATAAAPTTEISNGTASVLNPTARRVTPAATVSLIAPAACTITVEVFA